MEFVQELGAIVLQAFSLVLMGLAAWALKALKRKFDIGEQAEMEKLFKMAVRRAVLSAEEWAAEQLKLPEVDCITSYQKLEHAMNLLKTVAPKASDGELLSAIREALAEAKDMGATGEAKGFGIEDPYK